MSGSGPWGGSTTTNKHGHGAVEPIKVNPATARARIHQTPAATPLQVNHDAESIQNQMLFQHTDDGFWRNARLQNSQSRTFWQMRSRSPAS